MRRLALVLVGFVGLASCNVLDIIAPARARAGETIDVRVNLGTATEADPFSFCIDRPSDWAVGTRSFTIEREPPVSGALDVASGVDTEFITGAAPPSAGSVWSCFDAGSSIIGDRGYVNLQLVTGTPGSYVLRFALVIHSGITISRIASHAIVIDGLPRYDANTAPALLTQPHDSVATGNGVFVVGGFGPSVLVGNGVTFASHDTGAGVGMSAVAFGAGTFVAVGDDAVIVTSQDGVSWSAPRLPPDDAKVLYTVFRGANRFIAAGLDGQIVQSADGVTWSDAAQTGLDPTTDWTAGAAAANSEVLIGYTVDATVIAVADNDGPFAVRTIANVERPRAVAHAPEVGWVFALGSGAIARTSDLVSATQSPLWPLESDSSAFTAAGAVYVGGLGALYRITATEALPVGTHGGGFVTHGADDGQRIVVIASTGNANEGYLSTIPLARAAVDASTLEFAAAGEQRTFSVRNDGLGAMYVALASSGGSSASGCAEALQPGTSCTVTVTLDDTANPGDVIVSTSAAFTASHVVALTYSGTTGGADRDTDDGCAAAPGSPMALLAVYFCLSFFSSRTRSTRLLGRDRPF